MNKKTKVAIIGTQGVPAGYGGFESMVDNIIGANTNGDISYTVFCSSKDKDKSLKEYKGCRLKYIPLHANGMQSIPYDILSMIRAVYGYDTLLILGTSGCTFLPILRCLTRARLIVNIDGLEHKRAKWGKLARTVLRLSEKAAVRAADVIIADNKGIQDYVSQTYHKDAIVITYGGDNAIRHITEEKQAEILKSYDLEKDNYSISVCRIEPENNASMILEAFAKTGMPLVYIGNWNHNAYARQLRKQYEHVANIKMLDSIYDLDVLYALRHNCYFYVHGHSAGGTNPSLVEAMSIGCRVLAYDIVYNRETTFGQADYFTDADSLATLLTTSQADGKLMKQLALENYTWEKIAKEYEQIF